MQDLGTLGGTVSQAFGINAGGQVVGLSYPAGTDSFHAFLYPSPGGPMQDLSTLGGNTSEAHAINAGGQVVGYSTNSSGQNHAFSYPYPGGPMQDLGTLGGTYSYAYGINASGQVVGGSFAGNGSYRAFLYPYPGGPMQDLGTLGGTGSHAHGINASGQVVGAATTTGNASWHAFLYPYPGGPMQDLGTLGGSYTCAYGINASGQVVGWGRTAGDASTHAFFYTNGKMQDLNELVDLPPGVFLSEAHGINDQGWIVGSTSSQHAFLLTPHRKPYTFHDLGTLGGTSSEAYGINASGQVVGTSFLAGDASWHAFLYPYPGGPMQDLGTLGGLCRHRLWHQRQRPSGGIFISSRQYLTACLPIPLSRRPHAGPGYPGA